MNFFKACLFVFALLVLMAIGDKLLDHYDSKNINNFSKEEKPEKLLGKPKVPNINIEKLTEQEINNSTFTFWIEKDTSCRFVTHSSQSGNDSGDSSLISLGCGVKSDAKPGFKLLKQNDKFNLVEDSWTKKKYLVFKHSIIEYSGK